MKHDAIVVGGGMAGLAAAFRLRARGLDTVLLDAAPQLGGVVGTDVAGPDGAYRFERGPNSLRGSSPAIASLMHALGVADQRVEASPDAKLRWLWSDGKRQAFPGGPRDLATTRLMSTRGKLRLALEPFLPRWRGEPGDTTVADFLTARLGSEAVRAFVYPFATGVYAGDPRKLGVEAFSFIEAAARAGGVMRAASTVRSAGSGMWSFRDGLGILPEGLARVLGTAGRTNAPVAAIKPGTGLHTVTLASGEELQAPRVVMATSWQASQRLMIGVPSIAIGPVVTVGLGIAASDFADPPRGFGLLVSPDSPLGDTIGLVFGSCVFAGRAPAGKLALTAILGGVGHPGVADRDDDALIGDALQALERTFGLRGKPEAVCLTRVPGGIAQIAPGHRARMAEAVARLPAGIAWAGGWTDNPALEATTMSGLRAADRVTQV